MGRLKQIHDRLFQSYVYTTKYGYFRGFKIVGRMPWFQRRVYDESSERELQFFEGLDLKGNVIYDVGASSGSHTLMFRRLIGPTGHVYSFEPEPTCFLGLTQHIKINELSNVSAFQLALGNAFEQRKMVVPDPARVSLAGTLSESLQSVLTAEQVLKELTVDVVRMDDWHREHQAKDPDLIKIDVEGFELQVIDGAQELLEHARPLVFIEIDGADTQEREHIARGVMTRLRKLGYGFVHMETDRIVNPDRVEHATSGHLYCTPVT